MIQVTPVILCVSYGHCLWPLSFADFPKLFLRLIGNDNLFEQVAQSLAHLGNTNIQIANLIIKTGNAIAFWRLNYCVKQALNSAAVYWNPQAAIPPPDSIYRYCFLCWFLQRPIKLKQ